MNYLKLGVLMAAAAVAIGSAAQANDWPSWRGPENNGQSRETGLPENAKTLLWKMPYGARSGPVIHNGRVYTIGLYTPPDKKEKDAWLMQQERVAAFNLSDGKLVWEKRFNVFHTDVPNSRVGWTNPVVDPETGNVYIHGVNGLVVCFSRDGDILWQKSLTELYGRVSGYGGRTQTPIIDEDRLVLTSVFSSLGNQAKGGYRFLALDKKTGDVQWWSEPGDAPVDTNYSGIAVGVIGGKRVLVSGGCEGKVLCVEARTGKTLWTFKFSQLALNTTPIIDGDRVYISHSEENAKEGVTKMGGVVCIDGTAKPDKGDITKTGEVWRAEVEAGYCSPALSNGRLYLVDNSAVLFCVDAKDGKILWKLKIGRVGKGSPVVADGKIYVQEVNSKFQIVKDEGDKGVILDTYEVPKADGLTVEMNGTPAISNGRIVFASSRELFCIGADNGAKGKAEIPSLAKEKAADPNAAIATLRVTPGEVFLKPGASATFTAKAYDANGRFLKEVKPEKWDLLPGLRGTADADGKFTADAQGGQFGMLKATFKVGDKETTQTTRVRVVPNLPISEDFEKIPPNGMVSWWVGASLAKHSIVDEGGSKALRKIADAKGPMVNRARVYITEPIPTGYVVQADMMRKANGEESGDIGLINARYQMEFDGNAKRLRIYSWVPGPRYEVTAENFEMLPDLWYTGKFEVTLQGDKALTRVKIWKRGEKEPEAWSLTGEDPQPNREGSAGLYSYSDSGTDTFFDNVKIEKTAAK